MRHIVALVAVTGLVGFGLAGCVEPATSTTSTATPDYTTLIAEVQAAATTACAFEPTADTIAKIATAQSVSATATEAVAATIASSICKAVTVKGGKLGTVAGPEVSGVPIQGHFVTK